MWRMSSSEGGICNKLLVGNLSGSQESLKTIVRYSDVRTAGVPTHVVVWGSQLPRGYGVLFIEVVPEPLETVSGEWRWLTSLYFQLQLHSPQRASRALAGTCSCAEGSIPLCGTRDYVSSRGQLHPASVRTGSMR